MLLFRSKGVGGGSPSRQPLSVVGFRELIATSITGIDVFLRVYGWGSSLALPPPSRRRIVRRDHLPRKAWARRAHGLNANQNKS